MSTKDRLVEKECLRVELRRKLELEKQGGQPVRT